MDEAELRAIYFKVLGRAPDAGGLKGLMRLSDLTKEGLEEKLRNSPEYKRIRNPVVQNICPQALDTLRVIQFESSTACNSKCIMCPHSQMTRPQGTMSDDLFHKIIKEGKEMGVRHFLPFLNGEPMLFPKLFEWLDYMQNENVTTDIFTNASCLDKDKADRLCGYKNINNIILSFYGAKKETYERVMVGLDFEKTKRNIEYFLDVSRVNTRLNTVVYMAVFDATVGDAVAFKKMWGKKAGLGVYYNWAGDRTREWSKRKVLGGYPVEKAPVPCDRVLHNMTIYWDGRVNLCCMDGDGKVILGDLNEKGLKAIWESNKWMRDKHRNNDFSMPLCRDCNLNRY